MNQQYDFFAFTETLDTVVVEHYEHKQEWVVSATARSEIKKIFERYPSLRTHGFLPEKDPLTKFPDGSRFAMLDTVGIELPGMLKDKKNFRHWAKSLKIPRWSSIGFQPDVAELRLYSVRLTFLASAYVHQIGVETATVLPRNIAVPLAEACFSLCRLPILSYDGYALYNWRRINPRGEIALGNIDTIQNFVEMYDEHWFILVHVEIEAIATNILVALARYAEGSADIDTALSSIHDTVLRMTKVLRRIPEHMDPDLYFSTFRPYIQGFENVIYEGVSKTPKSFRGETGAQSSIMPLLESFLKIPHQPSMLTHHLADMRNYMPLEHVLLLEAVDRLPPISDVASKGPWNAVLEAMVEFRQVHIVWAKQYIARHGGSKGTGGTPFMPWLSQLIQETLDARKN
ncbi:MAG: hypothetical protein Q8R25_00960 [bacterium]|nr:hypothetical protein [bacterium]